MHEQEQPIQFGPFSLYTRKRTLLKNGEEICIGDRALALLVVLAQREGEVVEKNELISLAWPNVIVEEANLRVQIHALRNLLGNKNHIMTVPRRGYRFIADVTSVNVEKKEDSNRSQGDVSLPNMLIDLIGRDSDIEKISQLLQNHRMISLVGMGGVGKTCIAIELANLLAEEFSKNVVFIDMSNVEQDEDVVTYISRCLGIHDQSSDAFHQLVDNWYQQSLLFVFDGCEHRLEELSCALEELMGYLPESRILTTSREPLHSSLEVVHRVAPLSIPEEHELVGDERLYEYSAIQLFIKRAEAFCGDFKLHEGDMAKIVEICRKLDGNPLAIEVAAGKTAAFGLDELVALLEGPFCLSMRGRRTAIDRHRTLADTISWSHDTLTEAGKHLLLKLAEFNAEFSLCEVIDMISEGDHDVIELHHQIEDLVNKSLLIAYVKDNAKFYRMPEMVKMFISREK